MRGTLQETAAKDLIYFRNSDGGPIPLDPAKAPRTIPTDPFDRLFQGYKRFARNGHGNLSIGKLFMVCSLFCYGPEGV